MCMLEVLSLISQNRVNRTITLLILAHSPNWRNRPSQKYLTSSSKDFTKSVQLSQFFFLSSIGLLLLFLVEMVAGVTFLSLYFDPSCYIYSFLWNCSWYLTFLNSYFLFLSVQRMSLLVVTATNGFISKNAAGESPVSIATISFSFSRRKKYHFKEGGNLLTAKHRQWVWI